MMGGETCGPGLQHSMLSSKLEWNLDVILRAHQALQSSTGQEASMPRSAPALDSVKKSRPASTFWGSTLLQRIKDPPFMNLGSDAEQ